MFIDLEPFCLYICSCFIVCVCSFVVVRLLRFKLCQNMLRKGLWGGFKGPSVALRGCFKGPRWCLGGFQGPLVVFKGVLRALGGVKGGFGGPWWRFRGFQGPLVALKWF